MKSLFIILLTLVTINLAYTQTSEEELVKQTLNYYIEGTSYNKLDLVKKAFADNATLYLTNREKQEVKISPETYIGFFKNGIRGEFNGRVGTILAIDIEKDIATAKAEILVSKRNASYIDLFLLKKNKEGIWKIISKTATKK